MPGVEHAYVQLAAILRKRIAEGVYLKGMPVPARHRLAHEFGVSVDTVNKGVEILRKEKLVATATGRGVIVL